MGGLEGKLQLKQWRYELKLANMCVPRLLLKMGSLHFLRTWCVKPWIGSLEFIYWLSCSEILLCCFFILDLQGNFLPVFSNFMWRLWIDSRWCYVDWIMLCYGQGVFIQLATRCLKNHAAFWWSLGSILVTNQEKKIWQKVDWYECRFAKRRVFWAKPMTSIFMLWGSLFTCLCS